MWASRALLVLAALLAVVAARALPSPCGDEREPAAAVFDGVSNVRSFGYAPVTLSVRAPPNDQWRRAWRESPFEPGVQEPLPLGEPFTLTRTGLQSVHVETSLSACSVNRTRRDRVDIVLLSRERGEPEFGLPVFVPPSPLTPDTLLALSAWAGSARTASDEDALAGARVTLRAVAGLGAVLHVWLCDDDAGDGAPLGGVDEETLWAAYGGAVGARGVCAPARENAELHVRLRIPSLVAPVVVPLSVRRGSGVAVVPYRALRVGDTVEALVMHSRAAAEDAPDAASDDAGVAVHEYRARVAGVDGFGTHATSAPVPYGVWRAGSLMRLPGALVVPAGQSLTIEAGVTVLCSDDAMLVVDGELRVAGTADDVVLLAPANGFESRWRGIVVQAGGRLSMQHAMVLGTGSAEFKFGHQTRQAALVVLSGVASIARTFVGFGAGPGVSAHNATVVVRESAFSNLVSGIEAYDSEFSSVASHWSHFPDPNGGSGYRDVDADGMYIVGGTTHVDRTVVVDAMDDCFDSGTGAGGDITIERSLLEACWHEGVALSSQEAGVAKRVLVRSSTIASCQQGIELGFSEASLRARIEDSTVAGCVVGVRYADNYGWPNRGHLAVRRCTLAANKVPVWNWHRELWGPVGGGVLQLHGNVVV